MIIDTLAFSFDGVTPGDSELTLTFDNGGFALEEIGGMTVTTLQSAASRPQSFSFGPSYFMSMGGGGRAAVEGLARVQCEETELVGSAVMINLRRVELSLRTTFGGAYVVLRGGEWPSSQPFRLSVANNPDPQILDDDDEDDDDALA